MTGSERKSPLKQALRPRLLGSTSLVSLTLLLADPLLAADVLYVKAPPTFYERFHISLEGGFLWNHSPHNLSFDPGVAEGAVPPLRPGRNGGMAGISFGRTIGPTRDWRVGWQGSFLGTASATTIDPTGVGPVTIDASNRFWFQTFDAEMGFRMAPNSAIRWFLGARVLNASNTIEHSDIGAGKLGNFEHRSTLWGVGPRAGLEATVPLQNSAAFLTMTGAGSVIFSHRNHDFTFNFNNVPPATPASGAGTTSFSRDLLVYNVEGSVALGYRVTSRSTLHVGYRAQHWWNVVPNVSNATVTNSVTVGNGNALVHGPFGRLTVAWP